MSNIFQQMDQVQSETGTDTVMENLYPALFQCFTIIICGYIAGRLNVITSTESKGIATFVGTFALPSLIFLSLAKLDFSTVNWMFLLAILLAKGLIFFSVIIITILVSKPVNFGRAGIFAIFCTQSNDFALGYPIINALYEKTHPEYASYLYLMAPISLAILNPVAFVLMEIHKQKEQSEVNNSQSQIKNDLCKVKLLKQIAQGIVYNPVLVMTVLGIFGNIVCKHQLSIYLEGLLEVFGQAFSASALILLGLRMVGQIHRLRGPALVLPCVLIMVKLIILPVVMRESVSSLKAGYNESDIESLSTYAFLYGTIPTAPAVFVFSNLYQLEMDLMASSMVICTFLSAPMMFITAQVISINKDYEEQWKKFGYDLSIVALIAAIWVILVFIATKKYKRMPHQLTLCLVISQMLLAISVIWGGPTTDYTPSWHNTAQQALCAFSMYSCALWTSMLSVGILMLECRGECALVRVAPALRLVAVAAPGAMVGALLAARGFDRTALDALRLCLLVFCLTVSSGCLIVYIRWRRRSAQFASLSSDIATQSPPDESTGLVDNADPISQTQSISNHVGYRTITASPSPSRNANGCCSYDPNCEGYINTDDIEDIVDDNDEQGVTARARPRSAQLLKHTVLLIVYSFTMFIGITYTTYRMVSKDHSGIFIEIEFLDIAANYGQVLVILVLFGLDPDELLIPFIGYLKKKWHGADTVVLPAVEDLSFETKHVCDQFITHHLERCKEAIAKDTRWRMRTYRNVFRGACLVRWLISCGLAKDEQEAVQYGRHLLDGRLIAHVNNTHHFTNSPLLYVFK